MASLVVLTPTRGRPQNALRLANAIRETAVDAKVWFLVDHDDPKFAEYANVLQDEFWYQVNGPQRFGPILNFYAPRAAAESPFVAFLGDDHLPSTPGWDTRLIESLGGRPGVAYGNDLHQGVKLPTAVVMSSEIVNTLGYMVPRPLVHLYVDNFWKTLGESLGNLAYLDDVIIEHLHPDAGKASSDEVYALANSGERYAQDSAAWSYYFQGEWPGELARLKERLSL